MNDQNFQISDVRQMMYNQMKKLEDPTKDLKTELQRAEAMSKLGTVIINSAAVEVNYLKITGGIGDTSFISDGVKQLTNGDK